MLTNYHFSFRFVKKSVFRALISCSQSNVKVLERIKIKFLCDLFIVKIENTLLHDFCQTQNFH